MVPLSGLKAIQYDRKLHIPSKKGKAVLEWLRAFQEVKVPRFHDNSTGWW